MAKIETVRHGAVWEIILNRPDKKNAADFEWLSLLSLALGELDRDDDARVGVIRQNGAAFTAGLDLTDIAPRLVDGRLDIVPAGGCDPWRMGAGPECRKPLVVAISGLCLTLGVELALAADVVIAAPDAQFGQIEVSRGIMPFGGATLRLPARIGWSNAMLWMLGSGLHDAEEAQRVGLVSELVASDALVGRALAIAEQIAAQAPRAVQATLRNARLNERVGFAEAAAAIPQELADLIATEDAKGAMRAFLTGQAWQFIGR